MTRSRRFFASSPWIATGTPDYVNLGYTSRGLAKQAVMRLSRKSLAIFRKLGLVKKLLPFNAKEPRFPPSILRRTAYFQYAACSVTSQMLCRPGPGRQAACLAVIPLMDCLRFGPCQVFFS